MRSPAVSTFVVGLALAGLVPVGTNAASAATPRFAPWTEAVVSVADPEQASRLFREVGGWRVVARGPVARAELAYWQLPPAATARFLKLCAPGADDGCIRFVRFAGVAQRPIRLAARPWDTGGIFSLMIRTTSVRRVFDRAIAMGWWAETEPYDFSFGGSTLHNVVLTGPHGINVALYERETPPFTEYPVGLMARAFNSMRMVRDQRASVAYYRDRLGFGQAFDSDYRDPAPGPTNFSIPHNLAPTIARRASAMHPVASGRGRVELMQFVGFTGKDVAAFARAPNLGILSVRYPVEGLADYRALLTARGVEPIQSGRAVPVAGLGMVDLFAVRDPDGNLTEFYAPVRKARR